MRWIRSSTFRYLATLFAGFLLGGLTVDLLAVQAIQAQVIGARADFLAEHEVRAKRARCDGRWFDAAFHSRNAANADHYYAFRVGERHRSMMAPLVGWMLLRISRHTDATTEGGRVSEGVDRAKLAHTLQMLGRPEAEAEFAHAAKLLRRDPSATRTLGASLSECGDKADQKTLDQILDRMSE